MDPTKQIKVIFGDLMMQIAVLQSQVDSQHTEIENLRSAINNMENKLPIKNHST